VLLLKNSAANNNEDASYNLTLIDFNIAVDFGAGGIQGPAGLKQWSAPETRSQLSYD
jgi:hypothetical protein